jgi:hypothetical protein
VTQKENQEYDNGFELFSEAEVPVKQDGILEYVL